MATLFDISLIGQAKVIFIFLLVYVVLWGYLSSKQPFGKNATVYALISLAIAFMVSASKTVRMMIEYMTPWFLFMVLLIFFILFIVMMFGVKGGSIEKIIKDSTVYTLILIVFGIVIIFGFARAYGQTSLEATQGVQLSEYSSEGAVDTSSSGGVFLNSNGMTPTNTVTTTGEYVPQPGEPRATDTNNFSLNLVNTLLHPKVLAIGIMFLIATFIVYFLTRPQWLG